MQLDGSFSSDFATVETVELVFPFMMLANINRDWMTGLGEVCLCF